MTPNPHRHTFNMSDETYYMLKELASLRVRGHVGNLVREIFEDYIHQHQNELLQK